MKLKCPECGVEAEVDPRNREVDINLGENESFPTHGGCELSKPIDEMNLKKLEEAG